jgi:uncharacterized RDD family membrane protein YckC
MKCNVCGNDYPNQAHFAVPGICESCFKQMPQEQQNEIIAQAYNYDNFAAMTISEKRVGFGRRLAAFAIDLAFCIAIYLAIFFISGMYESQMLMAEKIQSEGLNFQLISQAGFQFIEENMTTIIFIQFMYLLYFSLEIIVGASLGKLIVGIQVANQDGKPAKLTQLIIRYLLKYSVVFVMILTTIFYQSTILSVLQNLLSLALIVGCFFTLSQNKMAFQDMLAKTAVFKKNDIEDNEINPVLN